MSRQGDWSRVVPGSSNDQLALRPSSVTRTRSCIR